MIQYAGEFMETKICPELESGERTLILVTHDESCLGSNDSRSYCWRVKIIGRLSAFLYECHGILRLGNDLQKQHPDIPADSTVLLNPGANSEGYWKNSDLIVQVKDEALQIFKVLHPDYDGLFMFDNSQNHHAKAPNALNASKKI
jgi:hypothetical protein